jgi:nitrite reductase (cytochrome c-552)
MKKLKNIVIEKPLIGWLIFLSTLLIVFLVGLFGASIMQRRSEAGYLFQQVRPIADWEPRNEVWGENYPREYQTYIQTLDTNFRSKHNTAGFTDALEKDPNLVILWAGYAFARDYNQPRGHYHAIEDIRKTLRTGVPQPATCWTCKSTDVPRVINKMGAAEFYKKHWDEMGSEIVNPIGCQDCHDPKTMNLRVTRPAIIEAFQRQGKDIMKATQQEMRSLVCAQCHVEYYFKGQTEKYLTFPWDKGLGVDSAEAYYDNSTHIDFVNSISRVPILKAQHPDYEIFMSGIHANRGIACADCHMPYKTEGGVKFTDHHIQSPLANISNSCQVCHRESEATLTANVYERQDKCYQLRLDAEDALVRAHFEAKTCWDAGASDEQMKEILVLIRHAQWRWDYAIAGHGNSFHSPLEVARILGTAIDKAQKARILEANLLSRLGVKTPVSIPDISTKQKAQKYLNLDIPLYIKQKNEFLQTVIPQWDKMAAERMKNYK